ncbi:hypothetical protein Tco_0806176 [Tanacetum coccineum]
MGEGSPGGGGVGGLGREGVGLLLSVVGGGLGARGCFGGWGGRDGEGRSTVWDGWGAVGLLELVRAGCEGEEWDRVRVWAVNLPGSGVVRD